MKKMFVIKNLITGQFLCGTSSFDELQRAYLFGTRENAENHIESFQGELGADGSCGEILEIVEIFVHEDYF
jgi:hypothetical protein